MPILDHTAGDPAPLVLLPAMSCDEELYGAQIEGLGNLISPRTLVIAEGAMADATAKVLEQAPAEFILAGMSYGSNLALEVALAAPSRVIGLWLMGCNPGPHGNPAGADAMCGRVHGGAFGEVVEDLAASIVNPEGPSGGAAADAFRRMARRTGPDVFVRQSRSLIGRRDRRADLSRIACPTLLLWGRDDGFAGVALADLMAGLIGGSELVVIENCGHLPTLEYPSETTAAVRRWLAG